jgi:O-antigen ligase
MEHKCRYTHETTKRWSTAIDYLICIAILIQSALVIFQYVLMDVYGIDPEGTTIYRVVLTAIPMIFAIILAFIRRPTLFITVYVIALLILLLHAVVFPLNLPYITKEGGRFLLPVVIPSALCLTAVRDIRIVERSAVIISWATAFMVFVYAISFFRGRFEIDSYSMGFSYGCLLPMLILYTRRKVFPVTVSLIFFIIIVSIGSRGAAIVFVVFVAIDLFISRSRFRWFAIIAGVLMVLLLPQLDSFLDTIGINSRTLRLLTEGSINYTSGRDEIYDKVVSAINEHPVLGLGLFGDRRFLNGAYCHNLVIEVYADFGFIFGTLIILIGIIDLFVSYRASRFGYRTMWLVFALSGILPFMASSSYLIYNPLAILIGYSVLVKNNYNKVRKKAMVVLSHETHNLSQFSSHLNEDGT